MILPRGPDRAKIMIVGDFPSKQDEEAGIPFTGNAGGELERMLLEAGISPEQCFYTTAVKYRPPNGSIENFMPTSKKKAMEHGGCVYYRGKWVTEEVINSLTLLETEINNVKPNVVIALGNVSLWATTGNASITKWRGSVLQGSLDTAHFKVLPTYTPNAILRKWDWRWITVHDLKRAEGQADFPEVRKRERSYLLRPSFTETMGWLRRIEKRLETEAIVPLAVDLETRAQHIACFGVADSRDNAICIPFMCIESPLGYWNTDEELEIYLALTRILTHPSAFVIGQNYIYDLQYIALRMGFKSNFNFDTMLGHHLCFPGTSKGLDFISSLYCEEYEYWKGEGKNWDPKVHNEDQLWNYNCDDACNTFECWEVESKNIKAMGLSTQLEIQMRDCHHAFRLMLRGMQVDHKAKIKMGIELAEAMIQRLDFIKDVTGIELNPRSPKQMPELLYTVFKLPKQTKRVMTPAGPRYRVTTDKEAIAKLLKISDPIYRPILQAIMEYRSLSVYKSTFAEAQIDKWDGRIRCSIYVAGPETFRWATGEDAWNTGMNLQNIPRNRE